MDFDLRAMQFVEMTLGLGAMDCPGDDSGAAGNAARRIWLWACALESHFARKSKIIGRIVFLR